MDEHTGISVQLHQSGPIPLNATFTCAPGELIAIVGPSGAGKTTVLRTIAGLYAPAFARVVADGHTWIDTERRISLAPQHRRVGLVFQSYALFPHLTALGNVTAAMSHLPADQRQTRARALLALVHLDGLEARQPSALSGGQQQRVALARALAREPSVLLLDEPLSAVDRRTRRKLQSELRELRDTVKSPIILVTHDIDEAAAVADRLLVLDTGELLQDDVPSTVLNHPASARVADALDITPR